MAIAIEPFYRELGRTIREIRTKKRLTQAKLGELLDPQVTRASIANIENGSQRVLAHTLSQFAYHLDTPVQDLLPRSSLKTNARDEVADIEKELHGKLNLTTTQLAQLVRKLKRQPKEKYDAIPSENPRGSVG
jgi:transcriptional regulator with XRE-family HTH domain